MCRQQFHSTPFYSTLFFEWTNLLPLNPHILLFSLLSLLSLLPPSFVLFLFFLLFLPFSFPSRHWGAPQWRFYWLGDLGPRILEHLMLSRTLLTRPIVCTIQHILLLNIVGGKKRWIIKREKLKLHNNNNIRIIDWGIDSKTSHDEHDWSSIVEIKPNEKRVDV